MDDYIQQNNTNIRQIEQATLSFKPITLNEMDSVSLMNRVDTKYLISSLQLPDLLQKAFTKYRILEIQGERVTPYSTVYFDTQDALMYTMHHNGKLNRFKLRMRSYVNSGQTFLEIKKKDNKGVTSKKRISIENSQFESQTLIADNYSFLEKKLPFHPETLQPKIQNYFRRITLVDFNKTERITIDLGLKFKNIANQTEQNIENLAIIEIKQNGNCKSEFKEFLSAIKILPGSMSKYCLGMVMVQDNLKTNRFKNKIRKINKITQKEYVTV